jgi:hypothetical protein
MLEKALTKQEVFARLENAYNMGLLTPEIFKLADRWTEMVHRLQGGQIEYFFDGLQSESERTQHFSNQFRLANDTVGYNVIQLFAILTHHCQICATNPDAWHTRAGFCPHKTREYNKVSGLEKKPKVVGKLPVNNR